MTWNCLLDADASAEENLPFIRRKETTFGEDPGGGAAVAGGFRLR